MFKYYSDYGFQIAGLLTMMDFVPALVIGGLLAILLSRVRKRQGEGLRMLEVEAVNVGADG